MNNAFDKIVGVNLIDLVRLKAIGRFNTNVLTGVLKSTQDELCITYEKFQELFFAVNTLDTRLDENSITREEVVQIVKSALSAIENIDGKYYVNESDSNSE